MLPNESLKKPANWDITEGAVSWSRDSLLGGLSRFICSQRLPSGFVDLSAAVCGPSSKIITQMFLGVGSRCFPEEDFSAPCRYEMSVKITEWIGRLYSMLRGLWGRRGSNFHLTGLQHRIPGLGSFPHGIHSMKSNGPDASP
jgi:hypothetical protein